MLSRSPRERLSSWQLTSEVFKAPVSQVLISCERFFPWWLLSAEIFVFLWVSTLLCQFSKPSLIHGAAPVGHCKVQPQLDLSQQGQYRTEISLKEEMISSKFKQDTLLRWMLEQVQIIELEINQSKAIEEADCSDERKNLKRAPADELSEEHPKRQKIYNCLQSAIPASKASGSQGQKRSKRTHPNHTKRKNF